MIINKKDDKYPGRMCDFLAIFSENMNDNPKTCSGLVKPVIIKQLCLLFLNHDDNINYPNDPDQKFT